MKPNELTARPSCRLDGPFQEKLNRMAWMHPILKRKALSLSIAVWLGLIPVIADAQAPAYRRPPPPTQDAVFDIRARYMFAPDISFNGLGNMPPRADYAQPNDPISGNNRSIRYEDGQIRQDYAVIETPGADRVAVPTNDGFTGNFVYTSEDQIRDNGAALAYQRLSAVGDPSREYSGNADSSLGWEMSYTRYLDRSRNLGLQIAFSFNGFDSSFNGLITSDLMVQEFIHRFRDGQTAPDLPTSGEGDEQTTEPYEGETIRPSDGSGTQISFDPDDPNPDPTVLEDGARVRALMELRSAIYTFRAGPTYKYSIGQRINLNIGAGLSAIYYTGQFAALEQLENSDGGLLATRPRGVTEESTTIFGPYLDASAAYYFNQRVSVFSGLQYQGGSDYRQNAGEREVRVDLKNQMYLQTGLGIRF